MSMNHRLARLETLWSQPAPQASRFHHPWMMTLSDADLDILAETLGHLESGGDTDTLSPAVRDRYAVLEADCAAWVEGPRA